jgi:hypothetical protein
MRIRQLIHAVTSFCSIRNASLYASFFLLCQPVYGSQSEEEVQLNNALFISRDDLYSIADAKSMISLLSRRDGLEGSSGREKNA